jgi:hypothetical protein
MTIPISPGFSAIIMKAECNVRWRTIRRRFLPPMFVTLIALISASLAWLFAWATTADDPLAAPAFEAVAVLCSLWPGLLMGVLIARMVFRQEAQQCEDEVDSASK